MLCGKEEKNFESWYRCAIAFYDAVIVLYKNKAKLIRGAFAAARLILINHLLFEFIRKSYSILIYWYQ